MIDLMRYLMEKPKAVSISGATFNRLGARGNIKRQFDYIASDASDVFNLENMAVALIRFDNGTVLSHETSFSLDLKDDTGTPRISPAEDGVEIMRIITLYMSRPKQVEKQFFNNFK